VDFTDSWVDGLAFCALLHSFCPELVKYEELSPAAKAENLGFAFTLAEKLGIPRLIEPADLLVKSGPNKFFIITYLAQFVDHFRRQDHRSEPENSHFKEYEARISNKATEAARKLCIRSKINKGHLTKRYNRVNLVQGGTVSGTIRELKRKPSLTKLSHSVQTWREGTVTDRIADFNRKTGSQTTHVAGDSFISETVPSGLVAQRIAAFIKMHRQVPLDIEFIMVSSPKMRRAKRSNGQPPTQPGQLMSNIYYVIRQDENIISYTTHNPIDTYHNQFVQPLVL